MNKKYLYLIVGIIVVVLIGFTIVSKTQPVMGKAYSSVDVSGLPEAQSSETVELKNRDTYNLTASYVKKNINGAEYRMLAYNGSIPGPLIKVQQGSEVTINFKNDTDVNTLLHSHGVRMDNAFDGSQTSQKEMEPGETFTYKLKFPDAGMFWYHPHVREDFEQELGLYGNYLVVPLDSNYWSSVNSEVALFLDDILIENKKISLSKQGADHALMGRFGNVMLLNGETDYSLSVKKGEVDRFYLTNAANTRTFNFTIPGAKIKLVGADNGRYEKESFVDSILLGPSERAVVDVLFDAPGTFTIEHKTPEKTYSMGKITVTSDAVSTSYKSQFQTLRINTDINKTIPNIDAYFSKPNDKNISLTVDMGSMGMSGSHQMSNGQMMNNGGGQHMMSNDNMMGNGDTMMGETDNEKIEWEDSMAMMNQMADANMIKWKIVDQDTGKSNNDINWNFKVGDKVKIKIFNDPKSPHPMQHPIHFHGQRFLILSTNGVKNTDLVWKDTTLIQKGDSVEILIDMENPGTWMAHCHIAEHLEAGMMLSFKVE